MDFQADIVSRFGELVAPAIERTAGVIAAARKATDLDLILRAKNIDTLMLTGIATSDVILSTVRHGADADYRLIVSKTVAPTPMKRCTAC